MSEQEKNTEQGVHKRRTRYKGKYPRKFEEKYKELHLSRKCAPFLPDISASLLYVRHSQALHQIPPLPAGSSRSQEFPAP